MESKADSTELADHIAVCQNILDFPAELSTPWLSNSGDVVAEEVGSCTARNA